MSNRMPVEHPVTSLLLNKAQPYAEIDENCRIALGILQDDGWKVCRVGAELSMDFAITMQPVEHPGAEAALAEAEQKYVALRREVEILRVADERRSASITSLFAQNEALKAEGIQIRRRHWLAAAAGCFVCAALSRFHIPVMMTPLGGACVAAWRFYRYRRAKGAK